MKGRKRLDLPVDEIVKAYVDEKKGPDEIAARYGVSGQTIRNRIEGAGVPLRPVGPVKDLPMEQVAAEYLRGDEPDVLGVRYRVHPSTIERRLERHGVTLRAKAGNKKDLPMEQVAAEYKRGDEPDVLGNRYGVHPLTIERRLADHGVTLRTRASRTKDLPMEQIAAEYLRGDSLPVLGDRYGVHFSTIERHLRRAGVPIRTQSQAQRLRYGRNGDLPSLAADLGLSEARVEELLLRHGFIFETRTAPTTTSTNGEAAQ